MNFARQSKFLKNKAQLLMKIEDVQKVTKIGKFKIGNPFSKIIYIINYP